MTRFEEDVIRVIAKSASGTSFQMIKKGVKGSQHLTDAEKDNLTGTINNALRNLIREEKIANISNPNSKSKKKTYYKVKKHSNHKPNGSLTPVTNTDIYTDNTLYIGRGGEYAVMSELLFLGFDVNLMTVDKGQDIIAHKDGKYYFIQVKTTALDENGLVKWDIPKRTINNFFDANEMRYVLVARCLVAGKQQNRYFCFDNSEIKTFITQQFIGHSKDKITVRIKYENQVPYLFMGNKGNRQDVSQWENFESIVGRKLTNE